MSESNIYLDIAGRTKGAFMLGVVGPVRTGKSTFIKRFMELLVIPNIENEYFRERAKDELPQSGSGKTIMTSEPKFIPEEAVSIRLGSTAELSVRLVDCVGYMVEGAAGQYENGEERLVATPWSESEITMTQAAELGTHKVITEHSTIGIVVTTDGSICGIGREKYLLSEERVIRELKEIGKPFIVIVNSADPRGKSAAEAMDYIREKYTVGCVCLDCLNMTETDIQGIMQTVMDEFPVGSVSLYISEWAQALPADSSLKKALYSDIRDSFNSVHKMREVKNALAALADYDEIYTAEELPGNPGKGEIYARLTLPRKLYYRTITEATGIEISNDAELFALLTEIAEIKKDYDMIKDALAGVRECGYGVVLPDPAQMQLEEPKIVRQGGRYSVKLKATAPAIHMLMTNIETEVTPAIGGENASDEILSFLLQGFDGDANKIWQSNIFGKSLYDIAGESLTGKITSLPENARNRLRETLQRIINEGSGGLICILL